jgi:ribonuclease HI
VVKVAKPTGTSFAATNGEIGEPTSKKARTSTGSASTSKAKPIRVYTDGSSRGNGRQGAYAGVGVFFGNGDERSVTLSVL